MRELHPIEWTRFPGKSREITWEQAAAMVRSGRVVLMRHHRSGKVWLGGRDYRLYRTTQKDFGKFYALREEVDPEHVKIKLMMKTNGRTRTVDLADHLDIDKDTDWEKLKEVGLGGATLKIGRKPNGLDLILRDGKKGDGREESMKVRWEEPKKE